MAITFPPDALNALCRLYKRSEPWYTDLTESQNTEKAVYPLRRGNPPDERKEGLPMYVTYSDLIQIGIFIVALVGLICEIFKGRK